MIVIVSVFFVLLFCGIFYYLINFTVKNEQQLINNSYNSRQEILLSRNYRGTIFSADGKVLAQTVLDQSQNETREYPYGNLFSHVIGYDSNGKAGVEASGNYYLINSNIPVSKKAANDVAGIKNPGDNIHTTLNTVIQETASEELGLYKGAVIVTEVKTGKVLAMVSKPDFDPNEIEDIWETLISDRNSTVLLNRATQGIYPPGSTFKIVTALEYIRENPDTFKDYSYHCRGSYTKGSERINCYHKANHGAVDLRTSFAKSCNASFANIGISLDKTSFSDTLSDLLFRSELPYSQQYSKSSVNVYEDTSDAEMLQTAIGQGKTQITPLHLHMITSSIANKGILMTPYVIDRVVTAQGAVVQQFKPQTYQELMTEAEAEILKDLMTSVVEEGTAKKLKNDIYTAAGKTGSAEYNSSKEDSHAWFTGFAPADDPQICVTIIVEGVGSGGDYAVPMAKRIMNAYFTGHAYNAE